MGRIYDVRPAPGELSAKKCRAYSADSAFDNDRQQIVWDEIPKVFRVEFDGDEDEGPATVHAFAVSKAGNPIRDESGKGLVRIKFRCYCLVERSEDTSDTPVLVEGCSGG